MNKINMPNFIGKKLLAALRSGNYKQCIMEFVVKDNKEYHYCFLGLLLVIMGVPEEKLCYYGWDETFINEYMDKYLFYINDKNNLSKFLKLCSDMNDKGRTFIEMAKFVEENTNFISFTNF